MATRSKINTGKTAAIKKPVAADRVSKYKVNQGKGEYTYWIGDKECYLKPCFEALANIEADTETYFKLWGRWASQDMPLTYITVIFDHLNYADPIDKPTKDEIYFHFSGLAQQPDKYQNFITAFNNLMDALIDPLGVKKTLVKKEDDSPIEDSHPN